MHMSPPVLMPAESRKATRSYTLTPPNKDLQMLRKLKWHLCLCEVTELHVLAYVNQIHVIE